MWQALDNVLLLLASDGLLSSSLYNDQGGASRRWRRIKQLYSTAIVG